MSSNFVKEDGWEDRSLWYTIWKFSEYIIIYKLGDGKDRLLANIVIICDSSISRKWYYVYSGEADCAICRLKGNF